MTVEEIVKKWLQDNGYDGLCGDCCGCELDDLHPCYEGGFMCEPGYKIFPPFPDEYDEWEHEGADWTMVTKKPAK